MAQGRNIRRRTLDSTGRAGAAARALGKGYSASEALLRWSGLTMDCRLGQSAARASLIHGVARPCYDDLGVHPPCGLH
jgi:hypothetical protein